MSKSDYDSILAASRGRDSIIVLDALVQALSDRWLMDYRTMCNHEPNVLEFADHGFTFLFDHASISTPAVADRLVAAYGKSASQTHRRDSSRMRGFLGGGIEIPGKGSFDKGHAMAHASGGGLDVNLFPQRAELNRGRSPAGKRYRAMERYAARTSGTFVFSRFIYSDDTWLPTDLEFGILRPDGSLWIEQFAN